MQMYITFYIYIYTYILWENLTKKKDVWILGMREEKIRSFNFLCIHLSGYSTAVVWIFIYFVQCRNLMNRKCNYPDPSSSSSPRRREPSGLAAAGLYDRVVRSAVKIRVNAQNDTMLNRIIIIRMFTHVYRYYCFTRYFNDTQMKMIPAGRQFQHRQTSTDNLLLPALRQR